MPKTILHWSVVWNLLGLVALGPLLIVIYLGALAVNFLRRPAPAAAGEAEP